MAVQRLGRGLTSRQDRVTATIVTAIDTLAATAASSLTPPRLDAAEVVDVPTVHGPLYMHRDDRVMTPLIQRDGFWEHEEDAFLSRVLRPDATFLDVGANVGYFTVAGAKAVGPGGRVVSVEPEARNVALLRANLWRNGLTGVSVLAIAAGREQGYLHLEHNELNRGDHQVLPIGDATSGELVPVDRLDHILGGIVFDVVKIDAQGADHDVIEGMRGLLHPGLAMLCEFWLEGMEKRAVDPREVLSGYRGMGLSVALLNNEGGEVLATDDDVIRRCEAWDGRWVNLVLRLT
jgi:FkbM family methyltransferase